MGNGRKKFLKGIKDVWKNLMEAKNDYHHSYYYYYYHCYRKHSPATTTIQVDPNQRNKRKKSTWKTQDAHDKMGFSNTTIIILKTWK